MNTDFQNPIITMPEKTNRIAWQKPQLTEARIEDATNDSTAGTIADGSLNWSS